MLLFKIDEAALRYKRWSPKHEAGNYEPNTIERNTKAMKIELTAIKEKSSMCLIIFEGNHGGDVKEFGCREWSLMLLKRRHKPSEEKVKPRATCPNNLVIIYFKFSLDQNYLV
ncbi:hypothetical protein WN943_009411 [Citrus x changshan-huyou]